MRRRRQHVPRFAIEIGVTVLTAALLLSAILTVSRWPWIIVVFLGLVALAVALGVVADLVRWWTS